jgi:hypothetical protein
MIMYKITYRYGDYATYNNIASNNYGSAAESS